jgi:hypothetical protein
LVQNGGTVRLRNCTFADNNLLDYGQLVHGVESAAAHAALNVLSDDCDPQAEVKANTSMLLDDCVFTGNTPGKYLMLAASLNHTASIYYSDTDLASVQGCWLQDVDECEYLYQGMCDASQPMLYAWDSTAGDVEFASGDEQWIQTIQQVYLRTASNFCFSDQAVADNGMTPSY